MQRFGEAKRRNFPLEKFSFEFSKFKFNFVKKLENYYSIKEIDKKDANAIEKRLRMLRYALNNIDDETAFILFSNISGIDGKEIPIDKKLCILSAELYAFYLKYGNSYAFVIKNNISNLPKTILLEGNNHKTSQYFNSVNMLYISQYKLSSLSKLDIENIKTIRTIALFNTTLHETAHFLGYFSKKRPYGETATTLFQWLALPIKKSDVSLLIKKAGKVGLSNPSSFLKLGIRDVNSYVQGLDLNGEYPSYYLIQTSILLNDEKALHLIRDMENINYPSTFSLSLNERYSRILPFIPRNKDKEDNKRNLKDVERYENLIKSLHNASSIQGFYKIIEENAPIVRVYKSGVVFSRVSSKLLYSKRVLPLKKVLEFYFKFKNFLIRQGYITYKQGEELDNLFLNSLKDSVRHYKPINELFYPLINYFRRVNEDKLRPNFKDFI